MGTQKLTPEQKLIKYLTRRRLPFKKPEFSAKINSAAKLGYPEQSERKCDGVNKLLKRLKDKNLVSYHVVRGKGIIVDAIKANAEKAVASSTVSEKSTQVVKDKGVYKVLKGQDIALKQIIDRQDTLLEVLSEQSKLLSAIAGSICSQPTEAEGQPTPFLALS